MPDILLVKGMLEVGVVDSSVVSRITSAVDEWSHLSVFRREHRECVAGYLGIAPSMARYVYAWRICGLPLSDVYGRGFSFSRETKSVMVRVAGEGGDSLADMLTAPELPGDCSVHGELTARTVRVMRDVVYVANPPALELLFDVLPKGFVIPSMYGGPGMSSVVDSDECDVVDSTAGEESVTASSSAFSETDRESINQSGDAGLTMQGGACASSTVDSDDGDTVDSSVGEESVVASGSSSIESDDSFVQSSDKGFPVGSDILDEIEHGIGVDAVPGFGDTVDSYLRYLKPCHREFAESRFGLRVSYAALLAMPLHWFLDPCDESLQGDWFASRDWGEGGIGVSRLLSHVARGACEQGWMFPPSTLGEMCATSTTDRRVGLRIPDLSDEFGPGVADSAGTHVAEAGLAHVNGYCYRRWADEYPGVSRLGPWPTKRALEGVGVVFHTHSHSGSYFSHADEGSLVRAPNIGVVGGAGVSSSDEKKLVRRRVRGWEILDSGRDGPGATLRFHRVDDVDQSMDVVFHDEVQIYNVSRGGIGKVGLQRAWEYSQTWKECEQAEIPTVVEMVGNQVVTFEVGDMRP